MKNINPSIVLIIRRWSPKIGADDFASIEIILNGELITKISTKKGTGQKPIWKASSWLVENGYITDLENYDGIIEPLWHYANRVGITLTVSSSKAGRKKDL